MEFPVVNHPDYVAKINDDSKFPIKKFGALAKHLLDKGVVKKFHIPKECSIETMKTSHSLKYINDIKNKTLDIRAQKKIGFPINDSVVRRSFVATGGTVLASKLALETKLACNTAGGSHHATFDFGAGYCVFNDTAVAANYLKNKGYAKKILILDLDVHQGNGTAVIFKNNPNVFTCSVHGEKNYPFRKEKSDFDLPLKDDCTDSIYLQQIKILLPKLYKKVKPDFIFYLCGVDVLKTDRLGRLSMTIAGCKKRDEIVLSFCKENNIPVQCSMGGGYSREIKTIIESHANTFRVAKEIFT